MCGNGLNADPLGLGHAHVHTHAPIAFAFGNFVGFCDFEPRPAAPQAAKCNFQVFNVRNF